MTKEIRRHGAFELLGYHVDYYQDGKLMGSIRLNDPDRDNGTGYESRKYELADRNITFPKSKKKIVKGSHYYTELTPICGKVIGNVFEARNNH